MNECLICGSEFEEGTQVYDDTCDDCARDNGILDEEADTNA